MVTWYKFDEEALILDDNIKCFMNDGTYLHIIRHRGRPTRMCNWSPEEYFDTSDETQWRGLFISSEEINAFYDALLWNKDKVDYYEAHIGANGKLYEDTFYIKQEYREQLQKDKVGERRR